ncbi:rho GTPase-activating protein gacGG-like isoform X1 [Aedes albopictus]|uniref:Uncharacterized protein n=1 Tax=Aedes albopictus TaxID=7160 RepID=A0ABM1Z333_AEDAL|nr:rho GTPase-activating protein gacGG-like [Aedes albopictus]
MQPTAVPHGSTGGGDMDLPTVQSMDWVFQNKQLYFLAQYLAQQAEKKEKLSPNSTTAASMDGLLSAATATTAATAATTTTNVSSPPLASSTIIEQNGVTPPSPSTTPLSDDAGSVSGKLKLDLTGGSPDKPGLDGAVDSRLDLLKDAKSFIMNNNNINSSNNNNNNKSDSCSSSIGHRVSPSPTDKDRDSGGANSSCNDQHSSKDNPADKSCSAGNQAQTGSNSHNDSSSGSCSAEGNDSGESKEAAAVAAESRTAPKTLAEELSAKDREVSCYRQQAPTGNKGPQREKYGTRRNNGNDDDCPTPHLARSSEPKWRIVAISGDFRIIPLISRRLWWYFYADIPTPTPPIPMRCLPSDPESGKGLALAAK